MARTSRASPTSAACPVTRADQLKGFQRKEIRNHVNSIVEFLDSGPVLFPNAMILALAPDIEFKNARGSRPEGMTDVADIGTLIIPIRPEGQRAAWIVDGQQRSLGAGAREEHQRSPSRSLGSSPPELETQREQFILVNKAKPLPTRLINELLPEGQRAAAAGPGRAAAPERALQPAQPGPAVALSQADQAGLG